MVRAPCCDKMGLKKGPWTPEEDQILIAYVQQHGHPNWRALPKKAGLLRCGKSCRLRWINYLRPDIKRGNFSTEEEETIIKLHEQLGNKWSAMAAKLPGRTDNEIKNVWHTHLKKRLKPYQKPDTKSKTKSKSNIKCEPSVNSIMTSQSESGNSTSNVPKRSETTPMSPQLSSSSSEVSSISTAHVTTANSGDHQNTVHIKAENVANVFPEIDQSFWSDPAMFSVDHMMELQPDYGYSQNLDDAMEFWYDLFIRAGGEQELITDFE